MDKKVHMSTVHSFSHLVLPVLLQLSSSLPAFYYSLCLLVSQRPGSFSNLHLPRGREQQGEVQKAPWPSLPHLPSLGIFHFQAQTSALFWLSLKSLRSRGDKRVIYLSVPGFGCLEWQIFPTLLFFFLNGKWSRNMNWDVGTQANRLDCGWTSLSKSGKEGAHEKR